MTEPKKPARKRAPGAGRKPIYGEPMTETHTLRVSKRQKAKVLRIGDQAVRDAIDAAPEPQEPSKE